MFIIFERKLTKFVAR